MRVWNHFWHFFLWKKTINISIVNHFRGLEIMKNCSIFNNKDSEGVEGAHGFQRFHKVPINEGRVFFKKHIRPTKGKE